MLLALVSCREMSGPNNMPILPPVVDELIWVATFYVGGIQCDPIDHYTPPDIKFVLNEAGIQVYDTAIEYYSVCAACGCPTYAAMHFASIHKDFLEQAEKLGFHQHDPPPTN